VEYNNEGAVTWNRIERQVRRYMGLHVEESKLPKISHASSELCGSKGNSNYKGCRDTSVRGIHRGRGK